MIFHVQGWLAVKGEPHCFKGNWKYLKKEVVLEEHFVTKYYQVANILYTLFASFAAVQIFESLFLTSCLAM